MTGTTYGGAPIVVTGGRGRVGRLLVESLRARGDRVLSLARSSAQTVHRDDIHVDLTSVEDVCEILSRADADAIVHLASVLHGPDLLELNERIDTSVATAVSEAGINHVVLASSGSVYGTEAMKARTEASALKGETPYARSKKRTEEIFRQVAERDPAMSLMTLRIFNLSGPMFPESLVQRLIRADRNQQVVVTGADRFIRDYVYQDDLIAVLQAALAVRPRGETVINVGAGVAVSTRELLENLAVEPEVYKEVAGVPTSSWTDNSKMVAMLGIVPRAVPDRSWDGPET